jgi:hypothetical protein
MNAIANVTEKIGRKREKYRKIWNVVGEMRNFFQYVTSIAMDDLHL